MREVNNEPKRSEPAACTRRTIEDVRRWFDDGIPMGDAIRIAVGGSIRQFVERHRAAVRTTPQNAATMIRGARAVSDDVVSALADELGGTPAQIRELIWLGAKPQELATAS